MTENRFVWHELLTSERDAAETFYCSVNGWTGQDTGIAGIDYRLMNAGSVPVAGMMTTPAGAPSQWLGYVGVDDVDATAEKAKGLGATLVKEPADIPNVGRFAVLLDPQGAPFALFRMGEPSPQDRPTGMVPGHVGWNELHARDLDQAFAFYEALFGWRKAEAIPMGPLGTYQLYAAGEQVLGGMFKSPEASESARWLYYFNVPNIDAAIARLKEGGGTITHDLAEVPGGAFIVQARDPQGVDFALVGARG
jgi:predicted enzyme related to lactoylglutathione lyase